MGVDIAEPYRHEPIPAKHFDRQLLCLRTKLRSLDKVLGEVAVEGCGALVAVVAPAWRQQEVHDVQSEAQVTCSALFIHERSGRDSADVTLLADGCRQGVGCNPNVIVGLADVDGLD